MLLTLCRAEPDTFVVCEIRHYSTQPAHG
jgi:hypothetical protein